MSGFGPFGKVGPSMAQWLTVQLVPQVAEGTQTFLPEVEVALRGTDETVFRSGS